MNVQLIKLVTIYLCIYVFMYLFIYLSRVKVITIVHLLVLLKYSQHNESPSEESCCGCEAAQLYRPGGGEEVWKIGKVAVSEATLLHL